MHSLQGHKMKHGAVYRKDTQLLLGQFICEIAKW
jgi:hypothetical protein